MTPIPLVLWSLPTRKFYKEGRSRELRHSPRTKPAPARSESLTLSRPQSPPGPMYQQQIDDVAVGPPTPVAVGWVSAMPPRERRVLVVDDEPQVGAMLNDALTIRGYTVQVAETGPDALRLVPEFRPDVV